MSKSNIVIYIVLLNTFVIFGQQNISKNNVGNYLHSDNFIGYYEINKMNLNFAIKELMEYSLKDTIQDKDIWYSYNSIDSVWSQRSTIVNDKFCASIKLKSFYWILKILNSNLSKDQTKQVTVFFNNEGNEIYDYELIDYSEYIESIKQIIQNKNVELKKRLYKARKTTEYQVLENDFIKWFEIFQIKGLKYMKRHKLYPLRKNQYEIIYQIKP